MEIDEIFAYISL